MTNISVTRIPTISRRHQPGGTQPRRHDNPERGFGEFIAHDVLKGFMRCQRGWAVTSTAYGMDTALLAVFDMGRRGPVVLLNPGMGE
ncbi:hypothetical protein CCMA1212_008533 [Trichoderma ghanense]|uniref:Uncharacterized protein n=1 Tax=Trichoderma ghanense TaxID=65468 RepID=A0ABY2GUQ1_9HYPO